MERSRLIMRPVDKISLVIQGLPELLTLMISIIAMCFVFLFRADENFIFKLVAIETIKLML